MLFNHDGRQRWRFRSVVTTTYRALIANPVLEVEPTGLRGSMTTGSGRNGFDLKNFTLSVSPKRRQIELILIMTRIGHHGCLSFAIVIGIV